MCLLSYIYTENATEISLKDEYKINVINAIMKM